MFTKSRTICREGFQTGQNPETGAIQGFWKKFHLITDQSAVPDFRKQHWSMSINRKKSADINQQFEVSVFYYDDDGWPRMRVCNVYKE